MKRRTAVQSIILFSLGTGVIFSCKDKYQAVRNLNLKYILAEDKELDLIDSLSHKILPFQKIPSLENHTATPFILKMMEDCLSKEDRDLCISGYQSFDSEVQSLMNTPFSEMTSEETDVFIKSINEDGTELSKSSKKLFEIIKKYSITYLLNTEQVQRGSRYYQMAPGYFQGDIHMDEWTNKNAI